MYDIHYKVWPCGSGYTHAFMSHDHLAEFAVFAATIALERYHTLSSGSHTCAFGHHVAGSTEHRNVCQWATPGYQLPVPGSTRGVHMQMKQERAVALTWQQHSGTQN